MKTKTIRLSPIHYRLSRNKRSDTDNVIKVVGIDYAPLWTIWAYLDGSASHPPQQVVVVNWIHRSSFRWLL